MALVLRDYQISVVEQVVYWLKKGKKRILIVVPTGGGKTAISTDLAKRCIAKGKLSTFICHRSELLDQTYRTYTKNDIIPAFIQGGKRQDPKNPTQLASVNTLVNRLDQFTYPDVVFWDECFVKGTMVDGIPIENIRSGDMVWSFNHESGKLEKRVVKRTFKKTPKSLVKVNFGKGRFVACTANHPFYVKDKGYVEARNIETGDYVYEFDLPRMQKEGCSAKEKSKRLFEQKRVYVLFNRMWLCLKGESGFCNYGKNEQEVRIRKNEEKKSYEQFGVSGENEGNSKKNRAQTACKRRKWATYAFTSGNAVRGFIKNICNLRVCSAYREVTKSRHPEPLQDRYSPCRAENSYRGRRFEPRHFVSAGAGQKKGCLSKISRVESVEVQKQTSDGKFGGLCKDGYVYNIEVEGNHNYFAHNVLTHNCHHVAAKQWGTIFKEYGDSVHIGLTATPWRLDGKALGDYYDIMILGEKTSVLMERGFLVYYDYYAPSSIDTSVLVKGNKEYTQKSLEDANFGSKIIGDNIQHYKKIAMGKRNVVFAMNIKHSQSIVNKYNAAGIPARHLDGDTGKTERKKVLKQFANGEILVLSNVDLFGEGFDLPEIEVVSLLRPTQSLSLFLQMVGRGFRPVYAENYPINTDGERLISISNSSKTKAIILDHANNYETHGMPDDDREWSLYKDVKVKRKKSDDDSISIKRCPNCFAAHKPSLNCPYCGFTYVVNGKDIKEVAGELVLHGTAEHKQAMIREVVTVTTFKGLVDIENSRKYKKGWAENKWKAKTGEDLKSSLAGYEKISQARGYKKGWAYTSWNIRRNK